MKTMQQLVSGALTGFKNIEPGTVAEWQNELELSLLVQEQREIAFRKLKAKKLTIDRIANDSRTSGTEQQACMSQIRSIDHDLAAFTRDWLPSCQRTVDNCRAEIKRLTSKIG